MGLDAWASCWPLVSIVWSVLLVVSGGDIVSQGMQHRRSPLGIILYYLNTPAVKSAFGKAA